jgi:iron complex outermembrane receptor protein
VTVANKTISDGQIYSVKQTTNNLNLKVISATYFISYQIVYGYQEGAGQRDWGVGAQRAQHNVFIRGVTAMQNVSKFLGCLWLVSAGSSSTAALAQEALHLAADNATSPTGGSPQIAEVVVTAQRREQSAEKVPIALSVLTADSAQKLGVTSTQDLAVSVPGLSYTQELSGASFYIRGIGKTDANPGQELPVAIYVDGVYLATPTGGVFALNNIDRVEVLKGPQGTLFGRNATGGVIQVVTKDPKQTPSADGYIGYGNYKRTEASFYGTTGITNDLAADIAAYYTGQRDGWGHNITTGSSVYKPRELDLRSKWLWTPSEKTSVTLTGNYSNVYTDIGSDITDYPGSIGFAGHTNPGFYNIDSEINPFNKYHEWGTALTVKQDMSGARFTSISSYQDLQEQVLYDGDGTSVFNFVAGRNYPAKTFTQELQLLSPADSRIQWIGGLYYLNQTAGLEPLFLYGPGLGAGPAFRLDRYSSQHTDSYAVFGEATTPIINDDTHLTTGARYTIDKRRVHAQDYDNFGDVYAPVQQQAKWSSPSWRLTLDHQFDRNIFGYLQYSRGFKSGQFNVTVPSNPPVKPETLDAYEIGLKSSLFDKRLVVNVAAYFYNYSNIQLGDVTPSGIVTYNAAKARMKGFDGDLELSVTNNFSLKGGLAYLNGMYTSFPNAPEYIPAPGGGNMPITIDASGKSLINAPKWEGTLAAVYLIPTAMGNISLSTQYVRSSGFYFATDNRVKQPAYGLLNATGEWKAPTEVWGIRLWGKNLTRAKVVSYSGETAYGDVYSVTPPLTFGADLLFHFGK